MILSAQSRLSDAARDAARRACGSLVRVLRSLGHTVGVQNYIDQTGVQMAEVVVDRRCQDGRIAPMDGRRWTAGSIREHVLEIVLRTAGAHRTPPGAGPDTALGEGGFWFDSVELLDIIVACEQAFGMAFDPDLDLTPERLKNPGTLALTIEARLTA